MFLPIKGRCKSQGNSLLIQIIQVSTQPVKYRDGIHYIKPRKNAVDVTKGKRKTPAKVGDIQQKRHKHIKQYVLHSESKLRATVHILAIDTECCSINRYHKYQKNDGIV